MAEQDTTITLTIPEERRMLVGAELGQSTRDELKLDAIDGSAHQALVRIMTPVMTSAFARGLIEPSVHALGYDGFKRKYQFDATPSIKIIIESMARLAASDKSAA